jgi:orotate phosphoribosyltransferase
LGLSAKNFGEDFLKNVIEDDVVDHDALREALSSLGRYLEKQVKSPGSERESAEVGANYRRLLKSKKRPKERSIGDLDFYVKDEGREFIVKDIGDDYRYFLDLDEIFAEPDKATKVIREFSGLVDEMARKYDVNKLCFVEKRKGPLGAILMMSAIIDKTKLPAFIYRSSYLDDRSRIKGATPFPGDRVEIVYDAANTGGGLKEVIEDIDKVYGAKTEVCVVLYDQMRKNKDGRMAKQALSEDCGVELVSLYNKNLVESETLKPEYKAFLETLSDVRKIRKEYQENGWSREKYVDRIKKRVSTGY